MTTATAMGINLSSDQQHAVDMIRNWLSSNSDEFIMAGYAGTGKTTVIRAVYEELKAAGSLFVTPTAKAAHVLHCKGVPACTIHSAIYLFGGVRDNYKGDEVPIFSEREGFSDSLPFTPSRLVCDESSMINADMYRSIMDKGVPVMYVGDHGQLSCIGEDPKIMARPHVALEKIHRQAGDSGILRMAHDIRQGGEPSRRHACDDVEILSLSHPRLIAQHAVNKGYDQVIAAFNKTRHDINKAMRFALRKKGLLDVGDKIICRFNNRRLSIYNGVSYIVDRIADEDGLSFTCDLRLDLGNGVLGPYRYGIRVWKVPLADVDYKTSERPENVNVFEYGGCITGHLSQGSQFGRVLVAYQPCKNWSMARWGYTALTRAEKGLGVVV